MSYYVIKQGTGKQVKPICHKLDENWTSKCQTFPESNNYKFHLLTLLKIHYQPQS